MNRQYLLIVNPLSGKGSDRLNLERVLYWFKKYRIDYELINTEYQGHATEIVLNELRRESNRGIIACGGDGTINEVLTGMIGSNRKMGIIPMGTGNVFAREMHIPFSPRKLARMFAYERSLLMDTGKCNDRYFFLMFSAGFDAYSIKHTENIDIKKVIGKLSYVVGGLKAFSRYKHPMIQVKIDGKITDEGSFVMVSNTRKYAIWFTVTPHANPADGYLDVYIFKEAGKWNLIKLLFNIILSSLSGYARRREKIFLLKEAFYRAKKVELTSGNEVMTQVDGDLSGGLPAKIEIIEKSIHVILTGSTVKHFEKIKKNKTI